jgi:membrane-associated phospholipid phosphatase
LPGDDAVGDRVTDDASLRPLRRAIHPAVLATIVVAAVVVFWVRLGAPLDRTEIMIFCAAFAFALAWRKPHARVLPLLVDWAPLGLILIAYDFGRGAADSLGIGTNYRLAPQIDRWLTGTVPSVWLQSHLYATSYTHWWNVPISVLYLSHFFVSFIVLGALWGRSRRDYHAYLARFLLVTATSLALFVVHPAAPPWLDSQHRVIGHVMRTSVLGLAQIHLHVAVYLVHEGAANVNQVAAFPSDHAAYSALPLLFFWSRSPVWIRVLLVLYPLAMGFMLVVTGEHWVGDVLAGWIVAAAATAAVTAVERCTRRRAGVPASVGASPTVG